MDDRTSLLAAALDSLALELLLTLLEKAGSEKELVAALGGPTQPTVHKKLKRLEEIGLIRQTPAGRGAPWHVTARVETADLLRAMLGLADVLEDLAQEERSEAKARLTAARRQSADLRLAGTEDATRGS
jgi:DNA-binding IclR family transcriptional regulator